MSKKLLNLAKIIFIICTFIGILTRTTLGTEIIMSSFFFNIAVSSSYYENIAAIYMNLFPYIFLISSIVILISSKKYILLLPFLISIASVINLYISNLSAYIIYNLASTKIMGFPIATYGRTITDSFDSFSNFNEISIYINTLFYTVILLYIYKIFISLKKNHENKN